MSTKIKLELLKLQAEHAEMHNDLIHLLSLIRSVGTYHEIDYVIEVEKELREKWTKV